MNSPSTDDHYSMSRVNKLRTGTEESIADDNGFQKNAISIPESFHTHSIKIALFWNALVESD